MYASHGVQMKASTDSTSEQFAIAIAQRQCAKFVWRSNNPSIIIDVRGLGDKDRPTFGKVFRNDTSFQQIFVSVEKELRAQAPRTPFSAIRNSVRAKCRVLLQGNEFVKLGSINGPTDVVRSSLNIP